MSADREPTAIIVDNLPPVRRGLETVLPGAGIRVIGTSGSPDEALDMVSRRRPSVAVIDLVLGTESGLALVKQMRGEAPGVSAVIFAQDASPSAADEARHAGARGFVLKTSPLETLVQAISVVAEGGEFYDPALPRRAPEGEGHRLTERQAQIVALLAEGLGDEEIARLLSISPATTQTHVRDALRRLGARTRAHAVALAMGTGEFERRAST